MNDSTEAVLIMQPPPCSRIRRAASRAHNSTPLALTFITLSQPASVSSSAGAPPPIAALQTIASAPERETAR